MSFLQLLEEDIRGKPVPSALSPRNAGQKWVYSAKDEVRGDGVAAGTLITPVIIVDAGEVFYLMLAAAWTKVAACSFTVYVSTTNVVGGVETLLVPLDAPAAGPTLPITTGAPNIIAVVDNSQGATPLFVYMSMPQVRAGAATNNANTQYVAAIIGGILDI